MELENINLKWIGLSPCANEIVDEVHGPLMKFVSNVDYETVQMTDILAGFSSTTN